MSCVDKTRTRFITQGNKKILAKNLGFDNCIFQPSPAGRSSLVITKVRTTFMLNVYLHNLVLNSYYDEDDDVDDEETEDDDMDIDEDDDE